MAEKKMDDLPPSYSNLGYDSEPVAGPSAPKFQDAPKYEGYDPGSTPECPPPKFHETVFEENFRGYEANPSAPPPPEPVPGPGPGPLAYNPPNLVFENIYEACVKYVDEHCCYGKRFLNQMKLLDVINKAVFYYKLESFTEKRESETKSSPFMGGPVDGQGAPPDPWNMTVLPSELFSDCHVTTKIPHTDVVSTCSKCNGMGDLKCETCDGRGRRTCTWCNGTGRITIFIKCSSCDEDGWKVCWDCLTTGKLTCSKCDGHGKIKHWKVLNVTWTNHAEEYITDMGYLPVDLIRKAKGVELLKKNDLSLQPITNAPDESVNIASARILQSHFTAFRNEMIIRQRHVLRAVPLTRITYKWKEEDGEFYVYDTDRKVYFENYPQDCCWCACS